MRIRWLVRTVESKAYLRKYNVVGVRWCMYSCNCTCIYIGKLNGILLKWALVKYSLNMQLIHIAHYIAVAHSLKQNYEALFS